MLRRVALVVLLVAAAAAKLGDPCNFTPSPANGPTLLQDSACDVTAPYCTYTPTSGAPVGACTPCRVGQPGDPCGCNPSTSYCEQGGATPGTCQPYTMLNKACTSDTDCVSYTNAIVGGGLPLKTQRVRNEILSCVLGSCRPCNPSTWPKFYAPLNKPYTCPGYADKASTLLDRYATSTSRPGTSFSCNAAGTVSPVNATINYGYGYAGDWTKWTPSSSSGSGGGKKNHTSVNSGAAVLASAVALLLGAIVSIV